MVIDSARALPERELHPARRPYTIEGVMRSTAQHCPLPFSDNPNLIAWTSISARRRGRANREFSTAR